MGLSDTEIVCLITLSIVGISLLLDSFKVRFLRLKLFIGLTAIALAVALGAGAILNGDTDIARVKASTLPAGDKGSVDRLSLSTSRGRELTLSHYGYGAYVGSDSDRVTFFVGRQNGSGQLAVRSREPSGARDAGASVLVRNSGDISSVGLDFTRDRRPALFSDAPVPLSLETRLAADIVVRPGGRRSVAFDAQSGALVLPDLPRAPGTAPDGALVLVRGQLVLRRDGQWQPVGL